MTILYHICQYIVRYKKLPECIQESLSAGLSPVFVAAAEAASVFTRLLGTSLVDCDAAAFNFFAVHLGLGLLAFVVIFKFDEAEAFAAAGVAVSNDLCTGYGAELGKNLLKFF